MNSAGLNNKNIMNSVGTLNNIDAPNSNSHEIILRWTMFLANIPVMNNNSCACCREYNSTQISKSSLNVWIVNEYS